MDCIEFVKHVNNNHSLEDLEKLWDVEGYFVGVSDLYLVLYCKQKNMTYSIKLRPYHIKFIEQTLKPEQGQLIVVKSLGRDRSKHYTNDHYKAHFFNVKFTKKFEFYNA